MIFIKLNVKLNYLRRTYIKGNRVVQFIEVICITVITSCIAFGMSAIIPCRPVSDVIYVEQVCDNLQANNSVPISIFCKDVRKS